MTSPDSSQDAKSSVVAPTPSVPSGTQNPGARPAGAHGSVKPIEAQARGGNAPGGAPSPSSGTESSKSAGLSSTGAPSAGGGGLRQAVQELAASVDCLCGSDARDTSGAKRHLDQAKRFLASPSRASDPHGAAERSTSLGAPATRSGGKDEDIRQDLQRAMR